MIHRNLVLGIKVCRSSLQFKPFKVVYIDPVWIRLENIETGETLAFTVKEFDEGNWIEWE